jgi:hypothetical protein
MIQRSAGTAPALKEPAGHPLDTRWGLGDMVDMALFLVSCWLIVGLLLVLALLVGHAWFLALGLVLAMATGTFAAIHSRRDARLAESALRSVAPGTGDAASAAARRSARGRGRG